MSPGRILQALIRYDRKTARILLAAMGALAAVAIASAWRLDLNQAVWMALYVVLLGAAIVFVAETITNPAIRFALGWFTTALLMAVVLAFFISAVFPGWVPHTSCLAKPWENCSNTLEVLAEKQPPRVPDPKTLAGSTPALSLRTSDYKVFLRFGGPIAKQDRTRLQQILSQDGWQVQPVGADLRQAFGYNEIRYGDLRDAPAARMLQDVVHTTNICPDVLRTARYPTIQAKTMEVWVSALK